MIPALGQSHSPYDAPGTYQPAFRVEDAEGNYTESDLTVTVADAAPSGTFGWGDPVHTIAGSGG